MNVRSSFAALLVLAGAAARAETPVTTSGQSFDLNGYANVEFTRMFPGSGNGDSNGSFDMSELDLVLNWHGTDKLRVAADLGFAHGVATGSNFGEVSEQYAFVEYAFADWARLRAGKMFIPFGIYNEFHTAKTAILSVKEPRATGTTQFLGGVDLQGKTMRPFPRWGTGVQLLGNGASPLGDWDYAVAVTNGDSKSVDPFQKDDNKDKAVTARVRLSPDPTLEVGASYYVDWVNELDGTGKPTGGLAQTSSYGLQATWRIGHVLALQAEYVATNLVPSAQSGLRELWTHGAFLMAYGEFSEQFIPYARVEWYDPDALVAANTGRLYLVGLAVRLPGNLLLKGEVDTWDLGGANARYKNGDGNFSEVKLAVAVGF